MNGIVEGLKGTEVFQLPFKHVARNGSTWGQVANLTENLAAWYNVQQIASDLPYPVGWQFAEARHMP